MPKEEVDLINRDPNNLNDHLACGFEEVFGEPEGIRSMDFCWKISFFCFNCWKSLCYKLATFVCAMCISAHWGSTFACVAFKHIWCVTPFLKCCVIECNVFRKLYLICIDCFLGPLCETCGLLLSKIKIAKS